MILRLRFQSIQLDRSYNRVRSSIGLEQIALQSWNQQKRFFGGRIGGLKRKKQKRIPPYKQIGFGRLIEFFQKKHRPSRQIYHYQNVRTHLVNDTYRRRWLVYWYYNGLQEFRAFPYTGRPMEFAKRQALNVYTQLENAGVLKNRAKLETTQSGVSGVHYDTGEKQWIATWQEGGLRRFRAFSVDILGFHQAYKAAISTRKLKLLENRQFLMQKFRKRQGSRRLF